MQTPKELRLRGGACGSAPDFQEESPVEQRAMHRTRVDISGGQQTTARVEIHPVHLSEIGNGRKKVGTIIGH